MSSKKFFISLLVFLLMLGLSFSSLDSGPSLSVGEQFFLGETVCIEFIAPPGASVNLSIIVPDGSVESLYLSGVGSFTHLYTPSVAGVYSVSAVIFSGNESMALDESFEVISAETTTTTTTTESTSTVTTTSESSTTSTSTTTSTESTTSSTSTTSTESTTSSTSTTTSTESSITSTSTTSTDSSSSTTLFISETDGGIAPLWNKSGNVYNCSNCSDCNSAIADASAGDIVQLNESVTGVVGTCIDFNGKDDLTFSCMGNTISGDGAGLDVGIWLNDTGDGSNNNTIRDCPNISRFRYGIWFIQSSFNNISNVTVSHNSLDGIYLSLSHSNNLSFVSAEFNSEYGVYLYYSNYSILSDITAIDNNLSGVRLYDSFYNNLSGINASNNTGRGIYVSSVSENNILFNIIANDNNKSGVYLLNSNNNNLSIITANNNSLYGVYLKDSHNTTLTNSIIVGNINGGIRLNGSSGSWIFNNFFNNTNNAMSDGNLSHWNTTQQAGSRIYSSGAEIGGNYWTTPAGDGWSDVCNDSNLDGFCDEIYNITNSNLDYLPLTGQSCDRVCTSCSNCSLEIMWANPGERICLNQSIINNGTNNCINIQGTDGITFDCRGYAVDGNNVADYGIKILRGAPTTTNIIVRNCIVSDWGTANIFLVNANGNTLQNIVTKSSPEPGLWLEDSGYNTLINITTKDNQMEGIYFYNNAYNNNLSNITANNNFYDGIRLFNSSGNNLFQLSVINNSQFGIILFYSVNNTVSYMNITKPAGKQGLHVIGNSFLDYASNNFTEVYVNNRTVIYNVSQQNKNINISNAGHVHLVGCNNITLDSGGMDNVDGIYLSYTNNSIIDNTLINKTYYGIRLVHANNNLINDTDVFNNYRNFYIAYSSNNILHHVSANNSASGIYLTLSDNNTLAYVMANNNTHGITLNSSSYNNLSFLKAENNLLQGFNLTSSSNNLFHMVMARNNTYGFYLKDSTNNRIRYGNVTLNDYSVYFLQDSYNNLFLNSVLNDSTKSDVYVDSGSADYTINNTFLDALIRKDNLTFIGCSGGGDICQIHVKWHAFVQVNYSNGSAVAGVTVYAYNKSGNLTDSGNTSTGGNVTLNLTEVSIWYDGAPEGPGSFTYHSNYTINVSEGTYYDFDSVNMTGNKQIQLILPLAGCDYTCINCSDCNTKIWSANPGETVCLAADITNHSGTCIDFNGTDNIVFDCQGYNINGTGSGYGISLNQSDGGSNFNTVRDCKITNFQYGIYLMISDFNKLINTTSENNSYGYYLLNADSNNFTNITALSSSSYGFYFYNSDSNSIRDSRFQESSQLDLEFFAQNDNWCNNIFQNINGSGGRPIEYYNSSVNVSDKVLSELILCNADSSNITNVTIRGSDSLDNNHLYLCRTENTTVSGVNSSDNRYGVYLAWSSYNRLSDIVADNNNLAGVYLQYSSSSNNITDASTNFNLYGVHLYTSCRYNTVSNISANNNIDHGFYLHDSSTHNSISNVSAKDNNDYGFYLDGSPNNILSDITAESNILRGMYLYDSSNLILSNINASDSSVGVWQQLSDNCTLSNITVSDNGQQGLYLVSSNNNNISNITSSGNTQYGIYILGSINNTVTDSYIEDNIDAGLWLNINVGTPSFNRIYNNYFNNTLNVKIIDSLPNPNYFNTSLTSATKLIGGTSIGGNF